MSTPEPGAVAMPGPASRTEGGHVVAAMLWMLGAIASFSAMAVAGREVSLELDTFEIMAYRSLVGVLIVLGLGLLTGRLREVNTRELPMHFGRNLFHFTGQNLWFYALSVAPLAQVIALEFTSPIWVMLLAALFLGERFTPAKAVTAAVGFSGVLMVARPDMGALDPGLVAAVGAALGFAVTAVFTKKLTRSASITCILFYLTTMQAAFGLVCGLADGEMALPSPGALPFVALIGCTGLSAHFCLTRALSLAPASTVMPMDFLRLPVLAVIGMAFYSEPLDLWVLLGGGLILLGNFINLRASSRQSRPARQAAPAPE